MINTTPTNVWLERASESPEAEYLYEAARDSRFQQFALLKEGNYDIGRFYEGRYNAFSEALLLALGFIEPVTAHCGVADMLDLTLEIDNAAYAWFEAHRAEKAAV